VLTRQWRPWGLLALEHGLSEAMADTTGTGDPSMQAARALRPACWHRYTRSHGNCYRHGGIKPLCSKSYGACFLAWVSGEQCSSPAGMGKPSLWQQEFWRLLARFSGAQSNGAAASTEEIKPVGSGVPGACLLVLTTRSLGSCCQLRGTKSAGSRNSGA
jgi:hypothetical protein